MFRMDVIKSFAARSFVTGVFAALAYAVAHVVSLGTSPENVALITAGLTYVGHAVHAIAAKYGVDTSSDVTP